MIKLYQGDCLTLMPHLPDACVQLLLTDLPYGCTNNKWDRPIDLTRFWPEVWRLLKPNGAAVFTAQHKFTIQLAASQLDWFRYKIVWDKRLVTGVLQAKKSPLRVHEDILVFYKHLPVYNPQMTEGKSYKPCRSPHETTNYHKGTSMLPSSNKGTLRYPTDILPIPNTRNKDGHATQKPVVALFEWLIRTYSNPGDLVLDPCAGSGTTCIAARNTGRHAIGIDLHDISLAKSRLDNLPA